MKKNKLNITDYKVFWVDAFKEGYAIFNYFCPISKQLTWGVINKNYNVCLYNCEELKSCQNGMIAFRRYKKWGFTKEDAYNMVEEKDGSLYKPSPIYKNYAVFKILKTRKADPKEFDKRKDYYFNRVKEIKKYEGFNEWKKEIKEKAGIRVYLEEEKE